MAHIIVKQTWLKLAEQPSHHFLQAGIQPYDHQLQTFNLLAEPDMEVIFNCVPTGGGKSLAAFCRALVLNPPLPTMALYPTNELARDQKSQLANYAEQFRLAMAPRVCRISANLLAAAADTAGVTKQTELLTRFQEQEIILTNPDIYHYIFDLYYLRNIDNRDKVFTRVVKNFDLIVFDEFHLFSVPQAVSAMNAILLTRRVAGPGRKKFLFLSATPSSLLREFLERANVTHQVVESECRHMTSEEATAVDLQGKWRRITHQVDLNFVVPERGAEQWMRESTAEVIAAFFRDNPDSKCAIILNSVAAAKRVVKTLRESLARQGMTIGENTGFSTESEKRASYQADVLVGTSTVDVGVDFKINLLLFEAVDASSFVQRFGRLGRHDGYTRGDGTYVKFQTFCAYALVPRFIHERLFLPSKKDGREGSILLNEEAVYSREELREALYQVYPRITTFQHYTERWGVLQSAYVYYSLGQKEIRPVYETIREQFKEDCQSAFDIKSLGAKVGEVSRYLNKEQGYDHDIFEVARSFRGTSGLECGVIDRTVEDPQEQFKTYDLTRILSNWRVSGILDRKEFLQKAEEAGISTKQFDYSGLFLEVSGFLDRPARWKFYLDCDLGDTNISRVLVLTGLRVMDIESEYQNRLNAKLQRQRLVCYILELSRFEVKYGRGLPLLFPVYSLADKYSLADVNPPFSIAFGQEALMLESRFFYVKGQSRGWII